MALSVKEGVVSEATSESDGFDFGPQAEEPGVWLALLLFFPRIIANIKKVAHVRKFYGFSLRN